MPTDSSLQQDVDTHFEFGDNWSAFAAFITAEHIREAERGLDRLLPGEELKGRTFLDIGCGSGLHSLAALNLGAASVTALDIDPASVRTAEETMSRFAPEADFRCSVGNVFDPPGEAATYDIVYSWGVLHHTGDLWNAIDRAVKQVADGGKLVIAIYLKTRFCGFWRAEKRLFTQLPQLLRYPIIWLYCALCFLRILARGRNPIRHIREYKRFRGMSWYHDRIDWLGGYPYESATPEEIVEFVTARGGQLRRSFDTKAGVGLLSTGCAEYVFQF